VPFFFSFFPRDRTATTRVERIQLRGPPSFSPPLGFFFFPETVPLSTTPVGASASSSPFLSFFFPLLFSPPPFLVAPAHPVGRKRYNEAAHAGAALPFSFLSFFPFFFSPPRTFFSFLYPDGATSASINEGVRPFSPFFFFLSLKRPSLSFSSLPSFPWSMRRKTKSVCMNGDFLRARCSASPSPLLFSSPPFFFSLLFFFPSGQGTAKQDVNRERRDGSLSFSPPFPLFFPGSSFPFFPLSGEVRRKKDRPGFKTPLPRPPPLFFPPFPPRAGPLSSFFSLLATPPPPLFLSPFPFRRRVQVILDTSTPAFLSSPPLSFSAPSPPFPLPCSTWRKAPKKERDAHAGEFFPLFPSFPSFSPKLLPFPLPLLSSPRNAEKPRYPYPFPRLLLFFSLRRRVGFPFPRAGRRGAIAVGFFSFFFFLSPLFLFPRARGSGSRNSSGRESQSAGVGAGRHVEPAFFPPFFFMSGRERGSPSLPPPLFFSSRTSSLFPFFSPSFPPRRT